MHDNDLNVYPLAYEGLIPADAAEDRLFQVTLISELAARLGQHADLDTGDLRILVKARAFLKLAQ